MGRDKSRLLWHGVPLYQRMVALLEQAGIHRVMISSGHLKAEQAIADRIPGRGPLSGIHAILPHIADGDCLLVVPVDMPLLPVPALKQLAGQKHTCCFKGFTLPLMLSIDARLREQVDLAIHSESPRDYSLWRLHQNVQGSTLVLPESMTTAFSNANTPEDWQQCQSLEKQFTELS